MCSKLGAGRNGFYHIDQDPVWIGDDEMALAEIFVADIENNAHACRFQPVILSIDIFDFKTEQDTTGLAAMPLRNRMV